MTAPTLRVHVVSPQFPCGAAWLANVLLELGLPITRLWGFDTAAEWRSESDGSATYVAAHLPWRQTLAALRPGRRVRFRAGIELRFSHEFPWQAAPADHVIFMVRDPRDALYSEYRRAQRNLGLAPGVEFPAFCATPFTQGPISQRDLLWLHLVCWLRGDLRPAPHLLRFEDCKHEPLAAAARVLHWLGREEASETLQRAVAASDVRRLRAIESELARHDPAARQFNRLGQPYEWRLRWPRAWHEALGPHWGSPLARLGYEALRSPCGAAPDFDAAEVLRWRGLEPGTGFEDWARYVDVTRRERSHLGTTEPA